VNRFFTDRDLFTDSDSPSTRIEDPTGTVRTATVHSGPIGSGDAVIADEKAEELAYLAAFNEKILAIDTEAGALAQACHERSAGSGRQHKWAVVRGISDKADSRKHDEPQRIAAWHAATVLRTLISHLAKPQKS
jgi:adenosylhomocysteine nucleosidase